MHTSAMFQTTALQCVLRLLCVVAVVGGGTLAWILPGLGTPDAPAVRVPDTASLRRQAVAFFQRRLVEDPQSALDMAQLAALLMEQGRMAGDERAFVQAESLARRSLGERTRKNGRSAALLAGSLLAQHRFTEAIDVARSLVQAEPDEPAYRALLAECLLEVGDDRAAIALLGTVRAHRNDLGIAPRFARWAELTGNVGEARRILRNARAEAQQRVDLTADQRAWFAVRLADVELRHGNLRQARRAIEGGLQTSPGDWRLILARARLEAAMGAWHAVSRSVEDVIAVVPSPEAFALLAEARRRLGTIDEAESLEATLVGFAHQPGVVHRSWVFAVLDRRNGADPAIAAVIAALAADTLVRRDVHTLDALAWALHQAGRSPEAVPLARRALRLGTAEPAMRFRAGMIELAAGDVTLARRHLAVAGGRRKGLSDWQRQELRRAVAATSTPAARS